MDNANFPREITLPLRVLTFTTCEFCCYKLLVRASLLYLFIKERSRESHVTVDTLCMGTYKAPQVSQACQGGKARRVSKMYSVQYMSTKIWVYQTS